MPRTIYLISITFGIDFLLKIKTCPFLVKTKKNSLYEKTLKNSHEISPTKIPNYYLVSQSKKMT